MFINYTTTRPQFFFLSPIPFLYFSPFVWFLTLFVLTFCCRLFSLACNNCNLSPSSPQLLLFSAFAQIYVLFKIACSVFYFNILAFSFFSFPFYYYFLVSHCFHIKELFLTILLYIFFSYITKLLHLIG